MNYDFIFDPSKIDISKWEQFVERHPKGNIFQTPQMYYSYVSAKNYDPIFIACINEQKEIAGILVGAVFSEKAGVIKKIISRCIIFGGPLLSREINACKFLQEYDNVVKKKAVYTRLANLYDNSDDFQGIDRIGYTLKDHINYNINLTIGTETIWKNIHNTRRRQINRGFRRGITIKIAREIKNLREFYTILQKTYRSAGLLLQDYSLFESVYKNLSVKRNIIFFAAYDANKLIGHRIILAYKDTLYDWFAGDIPEARDKYTNDVLVWEVLKWGSENGYKNFDFGGAGEPGKEYGVRDFKKKFGGQLVSFGNYLKIHQPLKYNVLQSLLKIRRLIIKK